MRGLWCPSLVVAEAAGVGKGEEQGTRFEARGVCVCGVVWCRERGGSGG